ncbi:hypothetical protein MKX01_036370 [Papaver californicum]|nr:hypothetical protein MKX01_036370 [Papaver californicum]
MTRRCSHCSNNGHNSRTCPTRGGVKLFGVRLTDGSCMKKSASMGNLSSHYGSTSSPNNNHNSSSPDHNILRDNHPIPEGYVSDDPAHTSCSSNCRGAAERKKGTPWTEEEHRLFLLGLQKLGKGDWRGIARNYVVSRTPTQVASHAQKYFIRQSNATRRKRRSSLFDMVPDLSDTPAVPEEEPFFIESEMGETDNVKSLPSLNLSLDHDCEHMETTCNETSPSVEAIEEEIVACNNFAPIPLFFPAYIPLQYPFWQPNLGSPSTEEENCGKETTISNHRVLKPTPILGTDRVNVDELGLSKLTLGGGSGVGGTRMEPSPLSMELLGAPSRQSAFHVNPPATASDLGKNSKSNAIHAV